VPCTPVAAGGNGARTGDTVKKGRKTGDKRKHESGNIDGRREGKTIRYMSKTATKKEKDRGGGGDRVGMIIQGLGSGYWPG